MTISLGIDPGCSYTGLAVYDSDEKKVLYAAKLTNSEVESLLCSPTPVISSVNLVGLEVMACYSFSVGRTVFETCYWIGRFQRDIELFLSKPYVCVGRKPVCRHICGPVKANDSIIRKSLISLIGDVGTKKAPGPTYGVTKDMWSALAIAYHIANPEVPSVQSV